MIFNYDVSDIISGLSNIDLAHIQTVTAAGEDLNDYTDGGVWYFSSSASPANAPGSSTFGYLVVFKNNAYFARAQVWINPGATSTSIYFRSSTSNPVSWNTWKKVATNNELTSGTATLESTLPTGVSAAEVRWIKSGEFVQVFFTVTRTADAITSWSVVATGLPTPAVSYTTTSGNYTYPHTQLQPSSVTPTGIPLQVSVNISGNFRVTRGETAGRYTGQFMYITSDI